ncbi:Non-canonical purine NTP pyrophosphatase [uncultured archaeon]|nr:Non-canonical purine NTP pyrophosphatase [uncultured archaeon]
MKIYFITGNKNKFAEVKHMLPEIEQLELDLEEIQEFDAHKVIQAKIQEAFKHHKSGDAFIIEDTSLYLDGLNGLPGPLIKWFMQRLKVEGIFDIVEKIGNFGAEAKTIIGYAESPEKIHFFEGSVKGKIVPPSGPTNFGWDPIFKPIGSEKTFQQMAKEEKNVMSMRRIAVEKLKEFLEKS